MESKDFDKFKDLPVVTLGDHGFVLTDMGLVNLRHVSHVTTDKDGFVFGIHGTSHMAKVGDAKDAKQAAQPPELKPSSPAPTGGASPEVAAQKPSGPGTPAGASPMPEQKPGYTPPIPLSTPHTGAAPPK